MRAILGFPLPVFLLMVSIAGADDTKSKKGPKRDPKVLALLKQTADLYKNAKSLHVEVEVDTSTQNGEDKQEFQAKCTYDLERPDRFALRARQVRDKDAGVDCISDGKTLLVHAMRFKQYTESPAPKALADLTEKLAGYRRSNTGFFFPNLLTDDPYDSLVDDVISCSYAGKEKIGDVRAHHVKIVHPEIKWEAWIAVEGKPLVLKMATLVAVDEIRITGVETYRNWKVDGTPEKAAFEISAPANATKVDVLGPPKKGK
jgi:hypothetical protein